MSSPKAYRRLANRQFRRALRLDGTERKKALIAAHELRNRALEVERIARQAREAMTTNDKVQLDMNSNGVV